MRTVFRKAVVKSPWLLMIALLLACGCSTKERSEVKSRPSDAQPPVAKPEDQEVKAATPDDPGPVAKVIVPLEVLRKQAKAQQAKPEKEEQKEEQEEDELRQPPLPIDHPVHIDPQESKHFLHKVFPISNRAQFIFLVPPHQGNAMLRGTFRSFTKRSDPDSTSDRTAAVDLLLLNDQEFNQFLHGRPLSVTYELDSANNQRVAWQLPTTFGDPQTYHLVFSNTASGARAKFVEADFTVSFE